MGSGRNSKPKFAATTTGPAPSTSGLRSGNGVVVPSLDIPSLPPPSSFVSSSRHPHPTNLQHSTSSIPDHPATCSVTPSVDYHSAINEDDIIIAVMGPTGAGKSSFINDAAGKMKPEAVIGYGLKSQTQAIHPVRCSHPDGRRNIVLVDTPGFDDTYLPDYQILRMIATWLKETYQNNIKLTGILYLHRITDVRMAGTPLKNLAVFKDLCGDDKLKNIILVTTMWGELQSESIGLGREKELESEYWRSMMDHGSRTCRFRRSHKSAWEIISSLDLEGPREALQIQQEMVDRQLPLHKTAAAKTLLHHVSGEFKRVWARMRNGVRTKIGPRVPSPAERYPQYAHSSSTLASGSTEATWSMVSTSTSSTSSYYTPDQVFSPIESTSSGCSASGRRDTLLAMTTSLRLAYQMAEIISIPGLRGAIGIVLQIVKMIEDMGGVHHAISQVIEYSGWLLEEIAQYAAEAEVSKNMKKTLNTFRKELQNLQGVVKKISARNHLARLLLYDGDIQAITACATAIRVIYEKVGVRLAIDNRQATARLEEHLKLIFKSTELRRCECGKLIIQENSPDNFMTFHEPISVTTDSHGSQTSRS